MPLVTRAAVAALVLFAVAAPVAALAQATPPAQRIAFVDTRDIFGQAPGRTEAEAQWQKELNAYQEQIKRMSDSLSTMIAAYQKDEATLSPAAKETRQKRIQDKQNEYQQRTTELEQAANQRQGELMQPIYDQIKIALEDVRTAEGYTFLFDVAAQGSGLVAADKNLNITDRVVARLRTMPAPKPAVAGAGAAPAKPAAGPAATPAGVKPAAKPPQR